MSDLSAPGCGSCGHPVRHEQGFTGSGAYHRCCAREVYGSQFVETTEGENDG